MRTFLLIINLLVCFVAFSQTSPLGDIVILGVNTRNNDNNCNTGSNNYFDNIHFVAFKAIEMGDVIDITDNGYAREFAGFFGTGEGVLRLTRTGSTINAGQVFSININGNSLNSSTSKIGSLSETNAWTVQNLNNLTSNSSTFAISGSGDQLFIMQGGTWTNTPLSRGSYSGDFLFAYNTRRQWVNFPSSNPTNHSGMLDALKCMHVTYNNAPNNNSYRNYGYYNGPTTGNLSKGEWLVRILNNNNWTNATSCSNFTSQVFQSNLSVNNDITEYEYCDNDLRTPLSVNGESNVIIYRWRKSIDNIIGNTDDTTVASSATMTQFTPPNDIGTFYYYCEMIVDLPVNGSSNPTCPFHSNMFKVTINPNPITSPVLPL